MDNRSIRPPEPPSEANVTVPPASNPGTVGPPGATPGDLHGVMVVDSGSDPPPPVPLSAPSRWAGWPAEWGTAWGGQVDALTDTAWACIDLNARVLATMPPYLVGAAPTLDSDWLNNPDPSKYASWADFAKHLFWSYHLGEAFVLATARYSTGWPARFHVVEPWMVNVEMNGADRVYSIGQRNVTADVLHIRYRTKDGTARGEGPLDAGRNRLIAAQIWAQYATNLATSGGVPPSVLEHPDELSADQAAGLQDQWITARMSSVGLPAVLSGGVTWKPTSVSPADMGLVDIVQQNGAAIAVLFGVPPFLVGLPSADSMTYSNVSSVFDYHWRAGLRPTAEAVCQAVSAWALPRGTTLEVNRDEYVRPDPYQRAQTWQILTSIGVLSAEEVRSIERFGLGAPIPAMGVPA